MKTAIAVVCLCVLLQPLSAGAKPVYKCEEKGAITYTDRPCTPDAAALELPPPIVTAPPTQVEQGLARANQERIARERVERDRDDAQWLKEHEARKQQAERERQKGHKKDHKKDRNT